MQIEKAGEADREFLAAIVPTAPDVVLKPMFGNLGAFVNGNMFAGLFGSVVGVRLDEAGLAQLGEVDGVQPFGPAGHAMGGYLGLPDAWRASPDEAAAWVARAYAHVGGLPPKAPKPRKK
ncbi:MAG: TfoX/Sxy family protein [Microbacteriaceae bacterium]|nr:TfoX/Sxy family protein [Microbacteriaceae bacterium]MCL2794722.1 TfoX/Sxy family protein [Microbacteriaceae bacterium]